MEYGRSRRESGVTDRFRTTPQEGPRKPGGSRPLIGIIIAAVGAVIVIVIVIAVSQSGSDYSAQDQLVPGGQFSASGKTAGGRQATLTVRPFDASTCVRPAAVKLGFYEISKGKTPEDLKEPLKAFASWINTQNEGSAGKMVDTISAKEQRGLVVLYLIMDEAFTRMADQERYQLTESIWRKWGECLLKAGCITDMVQEHVVLIHPVTRQIIGGSTPDNPNDLWVAENAAGRSWSDSKQKRLGGRRGEQK